MRVVVKIFLLVWSAAIFSGCGDEKRLNEEVNSEFNKVLNDPSSLRLKDVKYFNDGTVCGEFKAKNNKGGYDDYQPFVYQKNGLLGGDNYEIALGRLEVQGYRELDSATVRLGRTQTALSKFPTSTFVVGGVGRHPDKVIWLESREIWCSNLQANEKMKKGKITFATMLLKSYGHEYISSLEKVCIERKKKIQDYEKLANITLKYDIPTSAELSTKSFVACKTLKDASEISKAASENIEQLSNKSIE